MATSCLFSRWHTYCVCSVQCSDSQIPSLLWAARACECLCAVFSQRVWRAPYLWSRALTQPQTHAVRCELLLTEPFEVWRWEFNRIRQAAAVCCSCQPLPAAGVLQHRLTFSQSPLAQSLSLSPHLTSDPLHLSYLSLTRPPAGALKPPSPPKHLPLCSRGKALCCTHHSITQHSSWSTHSTTHLLCWELTLEQLYGQEQAYPALQGLLPSAWGKTETFDRRKVHAFFSDCVVFK